MDSSSRRIAKWIVAKIACYLGRVVVPLTSACFVSGQRSTGRVVSDDFLVRVCGRSDGNDWQTRFDNLNIKYTDMNTIHKHMSRREPNRVILFIPGQSTKGEPWSSPPPAALHRQS